MRISVQTLSFILFAMSRAAEESADPVVEEAVPEPSPKAEAPEFVVSLTLFCISKICVYYRILKPFRGSFNGLF